MVAENMGDLIHLSTFAKSGDLIAEAENIYSLSKQSFTHH